MKKILLGITLVFIAQLSFAQQNTEDTYKFWIDSVSRLYESIKSIEPCGTDFYTAMDEEPMLKKPLEQLLSSVDVSNAEFGFMVRCDVNCNGDVGNWQAAIDPSIILSDKKVVVILKSISEQLKKLTNVSPGILKNRPSDYRYAYFRLRISDDKMRVSLY